MPNDAKLIAIDYTRCTGCRICELSCSLANAGQCNPLLARIRISRRFDDGRIYNAPTLCHNCADPPCESACPTGATHRDPDTHVMAVDADLCIGCKGCVFACPFGACHIDPQTDKAFRCHQCDGDPICVQMCPHGVLSHVRQSELSIRQKRKKNQDLITTGHAKNSIL